VQAVRGGSPPAGQQPAGQQPANNQTLQQKAVGAVRTVAGGLAGNKGAQQPAASSPTPASPATTPQPRPASRAGAPPN
jgi:hypothetical protein